MPRVLVVDDEPRITEMIAHALAPLGWEVETAGGGLAAISRIREQRFDLVITDVRMGDADGHAVLAAARAATPPPGVILITGFATVDAAVRAIKAGAADYLTKPLDLAQLIETARRAMENRGAAPADDADFCGLIGRSDVMERLYDLIRQVGPTDSTVMISGPSGSGKELVARAVHASSPRRTGPFVPVDCAALTETLLESELFGHVAGSFTGAVSDKLGLFEAADGGTLFLDEVAEMSLRTQQKLLRCIQERAVRPVGSTGVRHVDVRIVSATNQPLDGLVAAGRFRQDLYYRLNVVPVRVPPLGDRRDDIARLAEHFVRKHAARHGRGPTTIRRDTLDILAHADWPGNVRQLENVIEYAVAFADGDRIRPEHLGPEVIAEFGPGADLARETARSGKPKPSDVTPLGAAIRYLERQMLTKALDACDGNKEQAATLLGIDRATLYRKMKALDIPKS